MNIITLKKMTIVACMLSLIGVGIYFLKNRNSSEDTLIIGMMSGYPPFMSLNNNGEAEGFDVDIANEIGKKLNKKIEIKDMSLAELFVALEKNKIDLLISGLNITKERLSKIAMIYYQGKQETTASILFWKTKPENVATLKDLKDKNATICVLPGSAQERFISQFDFIQKQYFSNYIDMIMALKFGKATAAIFESDIVNEYCNKFPELVVMQEPLGDFKIFGKGIGINKKNGMLIQKVDAVIKQFLQDGTLAQLEKKWITKGK